MIFSSRPIFAALSLLFAVSLTGCSDQKVSTSDSNQNNKKPTISEKSEGKKWVSLFDGKKLGKWAETDFSGKGEVIVDANGSLVLDMGIELTGVHWTGKDDYPKMDYEITLEAKRTQGSDFFCGLTFPYGESNASLILGGWGGGLIGISSIDDFDASENETGDAYAFQDNRWYAIKLRVTKAKLEAWIDEKQIIDVEVGDRKISMRSGEIELSAPLGIATYSTTGVFRNIRYRKLESKKDSSPESEPGDNEESEGVEPTTLVLEDWPDFSKTENLQAVLGKARETENLQGKKDDLVRTPEGQPFTGWKKGAYPSGELAILERYEDGMLVGQTFFWPNGQKKKEGLFLNGALDGTWIDWEKDGTESSRINYSNGVVVE